jgi:DNA-binding beta-propeller fold protein YncE
LNEPTGIAFDNAGNLYVANYAGGTIEKVMPGGNGSVFANSGLNTPFGLAFDSAGNLYPANQGNNTIEKFTPGGVDSVFAQQRLR